jgi:hypothetical protein
MADHHAQIDPAGPMDRTARVLSCLAHLGLPGSLDLPGHHRIYLMWIKSRMWISAHLGKMREGGPVAGIRRGG